MKNNKQALIVLLMALGVCQSACTHVEPWQRGNLAKPQMALDPNPMQSALHTHIHSSREAASGGDSAGGGGCGCY